MADDKKKKEGAEKPEKADKAPKAEKAEKKEKAPKADAAGAGAPAAEGEGAAPEKKKSAGKGGDKKGKGRREAGKTLEVGDGRVKRTAPPRLKTRYDKEVAPQLMKDFGYKSKMQVPKLVKIVLNMGMGEAIQNPKLMDTAVEELAAISGQHPVVTKAKKSIATFKLREGQKIGTMVTLRRERMYEFFDRLVNLALPRVRDFKGISPRAFDGRGNYSLGIREQIIFPEINYDNIDKIKGLNVSIVTSARTDEEGRALLKSLGMPFRS